ncbi:hypothetical protein ZIOFF_048908 [Zingiber officinale]|uniref:LOB domain-containing protein n=1 Tax=Zingiber officinale TaxID=94328 RepID=A0A8J5FVY3_ZINOF|nr:hypothetical protein ZIOFF_048908 [Zingiber officinale]
MSSSSSPCAACKLLRRKCTSECIFAPYFPAEHPEKFASVHRVFGASNVGKLLKDVAPGRREDAVASLTYEAEARIQDPVHGCVGHICLLQRRLAEIQRSLAEARKELATFLGPAAAYAPSLLFPHNHLHLQQHRHQLQHHPLHAAAAAVAPFTEMTNPNASAGIGLSQLHRHQAYDDRAMAGGRQLVTFPAPEQEQIEWQFGMEQLRVREGNLNPRSKAFGRQETFFRGSKSQERLGGKPLFGLGFREQLDYVSYSGLPSIQPRRLVKSVLQCIAMVISFGAMDPMNCKNGTSEEVFAKISKKYQIPRVLTWKQILQLRYVEKLLGSKFSKHMKRNNWLLDAMKIEQLVTTVFGEFDLDLKARTQLRKMSAQVKMSTCKQFSRIDTAELKSQLFRKLGRQRAEKYFYNLKRLLNLRLSKLEFEKLCYSIIGKENIALHNLFIRSILSNVCLALAPPSRETLTGNSRTSKLSSIGETVPPSPRRGRSSISSRDRRLAERSSLLGPYGKIPPGHVQEVTNSCDLQRSREQQSALELISIGSKALTSVEDGEEVDQYRCSPSVQSRSPLRPPLGILATAGDRSCKSFSGGFSSSFRGVQSNKLNSCHHTSELPDSRALRVWLERKLEVGGLGLSVDCANALNHGMDAFLRRLIRPCMNLARARRSSNRIYRAHGSILPNMKGFWQLDPAQTSNGCYYASSHDFRLAMEMNPDLLGGYSLQFYSSRNMVPLVYPYTLRVPVKSLSSGIVHAVHFL